jgi:UDP-N-acetylglucosamine--N-acetylmuramyl-(pentapeptide) pyrophosphoryl-undecaprenol N-acetylglucosamine transferase
MLTHNEKNVKILLTGGGTGGSVSPLLAIAEELKKAPFVKGGEGGVNFLWLGTKNGPGKEMVLKEGIPFKAIAAGKMRRYFSLKNFTDLFLIIIGFVQSFFIILRFKPDLVISAGSFSSVPVVWSAWILRVPILVHQQDVRPGLANKLMAPFASVITVTFEKSLADYGRKAVWTGNPARNMKHIAHNINVSGELEKNLKNSLPLRRGGLGGILPTVLIVGGGTGAMAINKLVWKSLGELTKFCNIIHITGKNKIRRQTTDDRRQDYFFYEFLDSKQMAEVYAAADIVVSRAGLGVLTELSYLGKPSILIPMPDSHQEENAEIFKRKKAAIVLNQKELTAETFYVSIKKLLADEKLRAELSKNIREVIKRGANEEMVKLINNLLK